MPKRTKNDKPRPQASPGHVQQQQQQKSSIKYKVLYKVDQYHDKLSHTTPF